MLWRMEYVEYYIYIHISFILYYFYVPFFLLIIKYSDNSLQVDEQGEAELVDQ